MQKFDLKDVCFFDCETTGVPAKGLKWDADFEQFPHVVQLAWSLGDKEKSYIIKPDNYEIPPETTAIHGITTERHARCTVCRGYRRIFDGCRRPHRLYVRTTFISIRRC